MNAVLNTAILDMKKFVLPVILVMSCFIASAQSARVLADKIVGIVGDKIILRSEIANYIDDMKRQDRPVPPNAECYLLEQMMADKALILQAEKDSLPVSEEEVEAELDQRIRYFVNEYGGKEAFEQIAGRTVYQVKEDFRKSIKDGRLAQAMRSKIVEYVKITPTEVKNYYDKIPKDSLQFYESELVIGQLVIYPKAGRELEKFAQDELIDYKRQAESGKSSFENLIRLYSDDPGKVQNEGRYELNKSDKHWDPEFKNASFRLKEGQISPIIKSKFGYHIIKMISRNGDDIVVKHILKIPQVLDEDVAASKSKLDSIRANLISGTVTFGEAVTKFSEEEMSKMTAGIIQGRGGNYVTIDELDKDLVPHLDKLKIGEFSQPIVYKDPQGKQAVRILFLQNRTEPHRENMKDDYNRLAQRALAEKKNDVIEKWFQTKLPTYYIMVDKEFMGCEGIRKQYPSLASK